MMSGAVSAGHPETAQAAANVLREGGNAFDAVLAGMAAACVCEPVLCSFGGGGFLMAKSANGEPWIFDFFAQTPLRHPETKNRDFSPVICDFGPVQQKFHIGLASMATPGLARGMFEVNELLGRMPLGLILEPAIMLAKKGVSLHKLQARIFQVVEPIYMDTEASRALFESKVNPGSLVDEGDLIVNTQFADFLDTLSREGDDLFYRGEIAARVAEDCRGQGGSLTRADFELFKLEKRKPLSLRYADALIYTNPPPSIGGQLIAFALSILPDFGAEGAAFGSTAHLSTLVQAMAFTDEVRMESHVHGTSAEEAGALLLSEEMIDAYRQRIAPHPRSYRGTTHISVVDSNGNAASLTFSNGEGCGYIVPDTGMMMNNMLGEEDINPYGFHNWPTNTRMSSMMAPSLIFDPSGRVTALGSGGSNRIRTAILQVLINLLNFDLGFKDAVQSPRVHYEGGLLNIEPGFPESAVVNLSQHYDDIKRWDELNLFFGGVHAVCSDARCGVFDGAGDPRRGGVSIVIS